ncbi:MAG: chromate efflux transporter [Sphingobacteriales bacterium]|nr:MAG: chromate efflux transporter [Sphingobacteriales bacterium]
MFHRHIPFLRAVLLYAVTAFGGPQGHIGMMTRTFVQRRRDVTQEELLEYNAFCQMLPGPSSTQTVILIAYKRGGVPLAIVTLLLWILPAGLLMTAASFFVSYLQDGTLPKGLLSLLQPMSVGFIAYAALRMMKTSVRHLATWGIMLGAGLATLMIRSPWVFPVVLIISGMVANFSSRRIPAPASKPRPVRWVSLWLFAALFILAGVLSEAARVGNWPHARLYNLFENFYRFGAIVFGGGHVLMPMMQYQFTELPVERGLPALLSAGDLWTGYGLVQAVPGPVFSLSAYVGSLVMAPQGTSGQVLGALVATLAVFLPSTLLLLFLFPLYQNLRSHTAVYRALEGIFAAIVGVIWASGIILFTHLEQPFWLATLVAAGTFCLLQFTRVPAPVIVAACILSGAFFG